MPRELARARLLAAMCRRWGYHGADDALRAPLWVVQATHLLEFDEALAQQQAAV